MTYKTLSGTYLDGYTLKAGYTGVSVSSSGYLTQPTGITEVNNWHNALTAPNAVIAINSGAIVGDNGYAGEIGDGAGGGGQGGPGGVGISMEHGGSVINRGVIRSGTGGTGAAGDAAHPTAGFSDSGGTGVIFIYEATANNSLVNYGTIIAGDGGAGGAGFDGAAGGYGGSGGSGVLFIHSFGYASGGEVLNLGTILGGAAGMPGAGGTNDGHLGGGVGVGGAEVVTNGSATDSSALIEGGAGVDGSSDSSAVDLGDGTVTNFGTIIGGAGSYGVAITGGVVINEASGLISGVEDVKSVRTLNQGTLAIGAFTETIKGTVRNSGTISVTGGTENVSGAINNTGVIDLDGSAASDGRLVFEGAQTLTGGGVVDIGTFAAFGAQNGSSLITNNTVQGAGSVHVGSGLTNTAAGMIDATGQMRIDALSGTMTNDGQLEATGVGMLNLEDVTVNDAGGGSVIVAGEVRLDGAIIKRGLLDVQEGGELSSVGAGGTINSPGGTIINAGRIESDGGRLVIDAAVENTGLIYANAGTLVLETVLGAGSVNLGDGVLVVADAFAESVTFVAKSAGRLRLTDWSAFGGSISGLSTTGNNSLELTGFAYVSGVTNATFSGSSTSGLLTIVNGSQTATLRLVGDYGASTFNITSNGSGGVIVTDSAALPMAPLVQAMASVLVHTPSGMTGTSATQVSTQPLFLAHG